MDFSAKNPEKQQGAAERLRSQSPRPDHILSDGVVVMVASDGTAQPSRPSKPTATVTEGMAPHQPSPAAQNGGDPPMLQCKSPTDGEPLSRNGIHGASKQPTSVTLGLEEPCQLPSNAAGAAHSAARPDGPGEPPSTSAPVRPNAGQQGSTLMNLDASDGAPGPSVSGLPPEEPLSPQQTHAIAALQGIVGRVSQLDAEGWFQRPVSEAEAPGYQKIVHQPMSFQVMRTKIANKQYVNWHEITRDFNLICNNAMRYNQKRSRVHRSALVMLRAGNKLLAEMELEGRRAVSVLHPGRPASGADPADSFTLPSSLLRGNGMTPPSGSLVPTGEAGGPQDPFADGVMEGEAQSAWSMEAGYSSFDATDMDEDEEVLEAGPQRQGQVLGKEAGASDSPAAVPAVIPGLQLPADAALFELWSTPAEVQPVADLAEAASPAEAAASEEWQAAQRVVEWRMRWVELRLQELARQRRRYEAALEALPAEEKEGGDGGEGKQNRPSAEYRSRDRRIVPGLRPSDMLEHPFFGQHGMLGRGQQQQQDDDPCFPAEAHAALCALERQLASLREQLVSMQQPSAAQRGAGGLARLPSLARRGRGAGRPRSTGLGRQPSFLSSDRMYKRRRAQESDLNEIVTPGSMGAPKFVERAQVKTIDTPLVRILGLEEVSLRRVAVSLLAEGPDVAEDKGAKLMAVMGTLCPGESSSDEDTSDDAYAARHAAMEAEERAKFEAYSSLTGGGRRTKRDPGKERSARSHGYGGGATRSVSDSGAAGSPAPSVLQQQQQLAATVQQQQHNQMMAAAVTAAFTGKQALVPPQMFMMMQPGQAQALAAAQMSQALAAAAAAANKGASAPASGTAPPDAAAQQAQQINQALSVAMLQQMLRPGTFQLPSVGNAATAAAAQMQVALQALAAQQQQAGTLGAVGQLDPSGGLPGAMHAIVPGAGAGSGGGTTAHLTGSGEIRRPRGRPPGSGRGRPRKNP